MIKNYALITIFTLTFAAVSYGQRPPGGAPGGGGRPGMGGPPRPDMQRDQLGPRHPDWMKNIDTDKNGSIDAAEFQAAIEATFAEFDRNGDGVISADEMRPPRPEGAPPPPKGQPGRVERPQVAPMPPPPGQNDKKILPPFFFRDRLQEGQSLTRAQFDETVRGVFAEMDKNHDGVLSREESRPPRPPGVPEMPGPPPIGQTPPPPPNARFIGAELRFGDKLVTGQPFSADISIEDTRRLFDGTTVTQQHKGAIYRDGAGRTRREQPLDNVGGFNVVGDNEKTQMLVFINDLGTKTQIFLDQNNKVARKSQTGEDRAPRAENDGPPEAKTESLGTKTIEGVTVEGTRTTFEIPAGQLGNAKPIQVVSEKWYSPELKVVVMSRHVDPLAGEHVFKLVNIKRAEPSADLFAIPAGYRVENQPDRRPRD